MEPEGEPRWKLGNIEHDSFSWPMSGHSHDIVWRAPSEVEPLPSPAFEPHNAPVASPPPQWAAPERPESGEAKPWSGPDRPETGQSPNWRAAERPEAAPSQNWSGPERPETGQSHSWRPIERLEAGKGQINWESPSRPTEGEPAAWSAPTEMAWPSVPGASSADGTAFGSPGVPSWQSSPLGDLLNVLGYSHMAAVPRDEFAPHQYAEPVATYNPFG